MIHIMKYSLKRFVRCKEQIFWILMFPMILGLLFKIAFSGISSSESFSSVPVAIICEDEALLEPFKKVCDSVENNNRPLLEPNYSLSEEDALLKLKDNEIYGIIYVGEELKLTLSSNSSDSSTKQSILESFVGQYNASANLIKDVAQSHPDKLNEVLTISNSDITYNAEHRFIDNNTDSYTQYFYNLIAMACLFAALIGFEIAIENQGNLSDLGIRRNASSKNKLAIITGELVTAVSLNYVLNMIAFAYVILVLKVDLTFRLPLAALAVFASTATGVSYGFFLGSIPSKKRGAKEALVLATIMFCCFLSGLMIGNMHIIIEEKYPILNRINPAALISDSLYCLANYNDLNRFYLDIASLIILTVIFTIGGFLFTRRKKYASL